MSDIYNKQLKMKSYNMKEYLRDGIQEDMKEFAANAKTQTGYANIDAISGLYPGMYVVGAISSLGKTTFVHQMCDQLAESGKHIIYFSLEQSALELVSKSLARIIGKKDNYKAMTSLQIRMNATDERVKDAISVYNDYAGKVTIVEGRFDTTIVEIEEYVVDYIQTNKIKPIVVIDYLQIIKSDNVRLATKDTVEMNLTKLKQLQRDNNLIMIVISSMNRQNYLTQVDYESFKESGIIEYSADVVWGLQLEVLHDEIFNKQAKLNEKRQKIKDAKAETPRKIELCCLKNRFGKSSYSCSFKYYPQYDYFVPDIRNDIELW